VKLTLSEHIRRSKEAVAANKAKGNKHAELFATMYTQPSRFIEEILQNTEDAYARKNSEGLNNKVRFKLYTDKLEIHHNGKDFDEDDLMSITTFASTTKKNNSEVNQIGKFGIGFKSVFSITDSPEIHCNNYHFAISDYEVLNICPSRQADDGFNTLIVLPFKRKSKDECFSNVKTGLNELNTFHLLFLKYLNKIEIFEENNLFICLERETFQLKKHIEKRIIWKKKDFVVGSEDLETFLVYHSEGKSRHKLPSLAFKVNEINNSYSFLPVSDAPLFVYFPLKMYSGLNFMIHAPFTTNPLRDYALFDDANCPENKKMLNDSVRSFVMALADFKKTGFYSVDLLAKLFHNMPEDPSSDKQKCIIQEKFFAALKDFLKTNDNIPLGNHKFSKIENVLIPQDEAIYHLLNGDDLKKLFQKSCFVDMIICKETYSNFRNFLNEILNIKMIDAESFAFRIKVTPGFLENKPIKWLKEFYKYLHSHQNLWDLQHSELFYSIRTSPIIYSERNSFEAAYDKDHNPKVFLQGRKNELFPVIHHKLKEDEFCFAFFRDMEIKEADTFIEVTRHIIPNLAQNSFKNRNDYFKLFENILLAYAEASQKNKEYLIDLLCKTAWVLTEDENGNENLSTPDKVYIKNDPLIQFFNSYSSVSFLSSRIFMNISHKYPDLSKSFFSEIGITDYPKIMFSEDYKPFIEGFENFISHIDLRKSKAFAKLVIIASEKYLQKEIWQFLKKQKWVYTKNNVLSAPETINMHELSGDYRFNEEEKIKLQLLFGTNPAQDANDKMEIAWQPNFDPFEVDLNSILKNQNSFQPEIENDFNLIRTAQTNLNFFETHDFELKHYSSDDIDRINRWSFDFIIRFLLHEFPEPIYNVVSSHEDYITVYKNGELFRHIFSCGKTDLMNRYQFSIKQFVNIFKLLELQEITFLYCVNSAGTSNVSLLQYQNPFKMFLNEKLQCNGQIFFMPE